MTSQNYHDDQTLEDYLNEVFGEESAEPTFQTVVHNILEEPIAEDTKRRLLAPLLPRDYLPRPPPRKTKIKKIPKRLELWRSLILFIQYILKAKDLLRQMFLVWRD